MRWDGMGWIWEGVWNATWNGVGVIAWMAWAGWDGSTWIHPARPSMSADLLHIPSHTACLHPSLYLTLVEEQEYEPTSYPAPSHLVFHYQSSPPLSHNPLHKPPHIQTTHSHHAFTPHLAKHERDFMFEEGALPSVRKAVAQWGDRALALFRDGIAQGEERAVPLKEGQ